MQFAPETEITVKGAPWPGETLKDSPGVIAPEVTATSVTSNAALTTIERPRRTLLDTTATPLSPRCPIRAGSVAELVSCRTQRHG